MLTGPLGSIVNKSGKGMRECPLEKLTSTQRAEQQDKMCLHLKEALFTDENC